MRDLLGRLDDAVACLAGASAVGNLIEHDAQGAFRVTPGPMVADPAGVVVRKATAVVGSLDIDLRLPADALDIQSVESRSNDVPS